MQKTQAEHSHLLQSVVAACVSMLHTLVSQRGLPSPVHGVGGGGGGHSGVSYVYEAAAAVGPHDCVRGPQSSQSLPSVQLE